MQNKAIAILKYFALTFVSLEIMYLIAKQEFNFVIVLAASLVFTVLFSISTLKPVKLPSISNNSTIATTMPEKNPGKQIQL